MSIEVLLSAQDVINLIEKCEFDVVMEMVFKLKDLRIYCLY